MAPVTQFVQSNDAVKSGEQQLTPLQQFYSGSRVFITGGTGFLGKALIEKLLRVCPDIDRIYLLVRVKRGKDAHTRIEEIFQDPVFDKVKELLPKFRSKLQIVPGDCAIEDLGLNSADKEELINNVDIVFHVAATVKFDENLRTATAINVSAIGTVLRLCKHMTHLRSAVHVSTAYSNAVRSDCLIEERFYETPLSGSDLECIVESCGDKLTETITPHLLHEWPNTYAFTKAIAEDVVRKNAGSLPLGIFRPSIVSSTYQEPVRGWVDNLYGPTGVVAGASTGLFKAMPGRSHALADVVPVDMTVNGLAAAAWDVNRRWQQRKKVASTLIEEKYPQTAASNEEDTAVPIYNYTLGEDNTLTWDKYLHGSLEYGQHYPTIHAIWYFCFFIINDKRLYTLAKWFLHLIPALIVDTALSCMGKKTRLWDAYKKIHKMSNVLAHFTTGQWTFRNENVRSLWHRLDATDQQLFYFDTSTIDWDLYFQHYFKGVRQYVLKDPPSTLEKAKTKWARLYWLHQVTKILLFLALIRFVWFIAECLMIP